MPRSPEGLRPHEETMIEAPDPMDQEFPLGDGTADDVAAVQCPHCGEINEIGLDPGGGARQEYVEDCQVCCRPWRVTVRYDGGEAVVSAEPL
jgi:hypothetical protein